MAVAIALLVVGVAPTTAVIGFCAKMPCCFEQHHGAELATNNADCCATINCYEAPSHDLTFNTKANVIPVTVAHGPATIMAAASRIVPEHSFDDTSPPRTTRERLSSLSILLI